MTAETEDEASNAWDNFTSWRELDRAIDLAEEQQESAFRAATLARWEFGRRIKAERDANGGKQLPKGRMAELQALTGKNDTELKRRAQLAETYPTEDEVVHACTTFTSWRELVKSFAKSRDENPTDTLPAPHLGAEIVSSAWMYRGRAIPRCVSVRLADTDLPCR